MATETNWVSHLLCECGQQFLYEEVFANGAARDYFYPVKYGVMLLDEVGVESVEICPGCGRELYHEDLRPGREAPFHAPLDDLYDMFPIPMFSVFHDEYEKAVKKGIRSFIRSKKR